MAGGPFEGDEGARILREVVGALEAIVVAMQAELAGGDPAIAVREAVRRVVTLRELVRTGSGQGGG